MKRRMKKNFRNSILKGRTDLRSIEVYKYVDGTHVNPNRYLKKARNLRNKLIKEGRKNGRSK